MEMTESKIMSSTDCDKTVSEFNEQVDSEVKKLQVEFEVFDQKLHCLDEFYFQKVLNSKLQNTVLLKIIFTLSHGQAAVKCGFSINQQVINQNMKSEQSLHRDLLTVIWVCGGNFTPPSPCCWFSLYNSETVKAVTLAFCSILLETLLPNLLS